MAEPRFSIEKVVEGRGSVSGALAVTASGQGDPGFLNTLLAAPLPPSDVEFGNVELRGEAGKSVILGSGKTKAEFKASAGAHGRFGAYAEGADVLKALKLKADEIGGLSLPSEAGRRYGVLDWGYEAALGGGVALQGKAAASIEGEGRRQARYIVLRHLKSDLKGRTFVARTLDSLILPSQVDSVDAHFRITDVALQRIDVTELTEQHRARLPPVDELAASCENPVLVGGVEVVLERERAEVKVENDEDGWTVAVCPLRNLDGEREVPTLRGHLLSDLFEAEVGGPEPDPGGRNRG